MANLFFVFVFKILKWKQKLVFVYLFSFKKFKISGNFRKDRHTPEGVSLFISIHCIFFSPLTPICFKCLPPQTLPKEKQNFLPLFDQHLATHPLLLYLFVSSLPFHLFPLVHLFASLFLSYYYMIIHNKVGMTLLEDKMQETWLRWFGHVRKRLRDTPLRWVDEIEEVCITWGRVSPKKTWWEIFKTYDIMVLQMIWPWIEARGLEFL